MLKVVVNIVKNVKKNNRNTTLDLSRPPGEILITIFTVTDRKDVDSFNSHYYYCYLNLY
jgi:hypothetical protein